MNVIGCGGRASSTVLDEDTTGDRAASNDDIPGCRWGHIYGGRGDWIPGWRAGKYGSAPWECRAWLDNTINNKIINTVFGLKSAAVSIPAHHRVSLPYMDDPSTISAKPVSPISQLLQNLGMTRVDLTRHSDQMRQFLTAENANSLRAFSNAESDADSVKSPTMLPRGLRAKSRSISAADAPPPPSLTPATPIKAEPVEPAPSSLRRFESMDEIIERQNRRRRREREASPGIHSPTRSSLRASGHSRSAATRDTRDSGRARTMDDSLPANTGLSQVGCTVILANSACIPPLLRLLAVLYRIHSLILTRPTEWAAITGILSSISPSHPNAVALLVIISLSAIDAHCRYCLGRVCSTRGLPLSLPVPQK